jgi:hypothetical protein
VCQQNAIAAALRFEDVQSNGLSVAYGLDGDVAHVAGAPHNIAQSQRSSAGRVQFRKVMCLGDGEMVVQAGEFLRHDRGELEHHLHADGEVRAVEQARSLALGEFFGPGQTVIPSRRADDHLRSIRQAGAHVRDHRLGRREVDDRIKAGDERRCQRRSILVFLCIEHMHAMAVLGRDLRNQFAGLAHTKDENAHEGDLPPKRLT